jgi:hypothetical protein
LLERGGRTVDMRKEGRVAARVRGSEIVLLIGFYMWVTGLLVWAFVGYWILVWLLSPLTYIFECM